MKKMVFVFSVCLALFMVSCSGNGDKVLSELQDLYGMESAEAGEYLKSKGFESFDDGHIFYRVDDYRVENIIFDEKRGEIVSAYYKATPVGYDGMLPDFVITQLKNLKSVGGDLQEPSRNNMCHMSSGWSNMTTFEDMDDCVDRASKAIEKAYEKEKPVRIRFSVIDDDLRYDFDYEYEVSIHSGNYSLSEELVIKLKES